MNQFSLTNPHSFIFSLQEDTVFMAAESLGHSSQPSWIEKGWKIMCWGNYSTFKIWGKRLISIISRISLWVTQHHSNHRGKEMASFHEGWKKWGMRCFHCGEKRVKAWEEKLLWLLSWWLHFPSSSVWARFSVFSLKQHGGVETCSHFWQ